jgi:enoyl-CoA hydratase
MQFTHSYQFLSLQQEDGIITLTINRLDELNALHTPAQRELLAALGAIGADLSGVRVLILTGTGTQAFIGGLDPAELATFGYAEGYQASVLGQQICRALELLPIPVIAAVNGVAIGGGSEIAMSCDLLVASTQARFQQIEVLAGLIPGFGGTWRLAKRIGPVRARWMIYTGQAIAAQTALAWGLVLEVTEPEALLPRCFEYARQIQAAGAEAVAEAKRVMVDSGEWLLEPANALERRAFATLFTTNDMHQRMKGIAEARTVQRETVR